MSATSTAETREMPQDLCDLVMKGGLTSGIAYPDAIAELSRRYRFRNIGGASAGAIAAAATAAAEYGREQQQPGARAVPFEDLRALGDALGAAANGQAGSTTLQALFQPTPKARPAFDLLLNVQGAATTTPGPATGSGRRADAAQPSRARQLLRIAWAVLWGLRRLALWALGGVAAGLLLTWTVAGDLQALVATWPRVLAVILALLVGAALGLALGVALRIRTLVKTTLPRNFHGMCSGMPSGPDARTASRPTPLTPWLHEQLQTLAGRGVDQQPLTFADLERVALPNIDTTNRDPKKRDKPGVRLQMMTTDVTLARPLRLPLDDPSKAGENGDDEKPDPFPDDTARARYYFSPQEFRRLFPDGVVNHMCDRRVSQPMPKEWAPSDQADVPDHLKIPSDLCTLPYDQLPVLVATRMSLSFPVLLSAVPLYTCRADDDPTWVRHWMSDGGIGSNFPIHFFDSLIPRWPTLALRFIPQRDGATVEPHPSIDDVECQPPPRRRSRARALDPRRHPEIRRSAITTPFGFLAAVLDTMQNWGDTLQSELPGYRDRIEDIVLAADEGGMNLAMGKDTIGRVRCKGKLAGLALKDEFDWEAHRLLRYMMSMRLLDESLGADRLQRAFHFGGFATDLVKDDLIESIAARLSDGDEESAALAEQLRLWYPATRRKHALECTEHLLTTIAAWSSDGVGDAQDASSGSRRSAASAAGDGTGANGSTPRYFRDEPEPYPSSVLRVSPPV